MNPAIALKWYRQARHDLEMAEKNARIGSYDVAAFLCQQSVEKLLKSILILESGTTLKTHYLDELSDLLGIEGEVRGDVLDFSADYMFAQYPDVSDQVPYEEYISDIALEKVERYKKVFKELADRTAVFACSKCPPRTAGSGPQDIRALR
jgi:HEPN domain-containing protein